MAEPILAHCFAHERAKSWRVRTASDAHQVYIAPELRFDDRQSDNTRVLDSVRWHEGEAEASRHHRQCPIVALAPIGWHASDPLLLKDLVGIASELAVHAVNVPLAIHL